MTCLLLINCAVSSNVQQVYDSLSLLEPVSQQVGYKTLEDLFVRYYKVQRAEKYGKWLRTIFWILQPIIMFCQVLIL